MWEIQTILNWSDIYSLEHHFSFTKEILKDGKKLENATRFCVFRLHFGFFDTGIKIKNVSLYELQLLTIKYFPKSDKGAIKTQNSCFPDLSGMPYFDCPENLNFVFLWHPFHFWETFYGQKLKPIKRNIFNFDTCVKHSKLKPENAKTCRIF